MAIIFFIFGLLFYKSKGKASNYLTGYNQKGDEEKKIDEDEMCKIYGIRFMYWAIPFIIGTIIDIFKPRIGRTLAWIVWIGLFIWHMFDRTKRENTKMHKTKFVFLKDVHFDTDMAFGKYKNQVDQFIIRTKIY